jgi:hypothetical protein
MHKQHLIANSAIATDCIIPQKGRRGVQLPQFTVVRRLNVVPRLQLIIHHYVMQPTTTRLHLLCKLIPISIVHVQDVLLYTLECLCKVLHAIIHFELFVYPSIGSSVDLIVGQEESLFCGRQRLIVCM